MANEETQAELWRELQENYPKWVTEHERLLIEFERQRQRERENRDENS